MSVDLGGAEVYLLNDLIEKTSVKSHEVGKIFWRWFGDEKYQPTDKELAFLSKVAAYSSVKAFRDVTGAIRTERVLLSKKNLSEAEDFEQAARVFLKVLGKVAEFPNWPSPRRTCRACGRQFVSVKSSSPAKTCTPRNRCRAQKFRDSKTEGKKSDRKERAR